MSMGEELFENDERVLINHITAGENLTEFTREELLNALSFQVATIDDNTDSEIKDLIIATYDKCKKLKDEDWENIKKYLPMSCLDEEFIDDLDEEVI